MKYYLTLALFCFYNLIANSQELIITPTAPSAPSGQRNSSKKELVAYDANNKPEGDWRFKINTRFNVTEHESPDVKAIKELWNQTKKQTYKGPAEEPTLLTPDPVISRKFEGPWMLNGTPPDNSLAISTGGNIVAVDVYKRQISFRYYYIQQPDIYWRFLWPLFYLDLTCNCRPTSTKKTF